MADSGGKGMEKLLISVFGREIKERERKKDGVEDDIAKTELIRMYTHAELGQKLKELRPEVKKRGEVGGKDSWYSLSELNERLKKLRVIEDKQSLDRGGWISYCDLRASLQQIQLAENKSKPQCTYGSKACFGVKVARTAKCYCTYMCKEVCVSPVNV